MKKIKKNNQWNGPIPINNNSSKSTTNRVKNPINTKEYAKKEKILKIIRK
jgi:hypothetical protein